MLSERYKAHASPPSNTKMTTGKLKVNELLLYNDDEVSRSLCIFIAASSDSESNIERKD